MALVITRYFLACLNYLFLYGSRIQKNILNFTNLTSFFILFSKYRYFFSSEFEIHALLAFSQRYNEERSTIQIQIWVWIFPSDFCVLRSYAGQLFPRNSNIEPKSWLRLNCKFHIWVPEYCLLTPPKPENISRNRNMPYIAENRNIDGPSQYFAPEQRSRPIFRYWDFIWTLWCFVFNHCAIFSLRRCIKCISYSFKYPARLFR